MASHNRSAWVAMRFHAGRAWDRVATQADRLWDAIEALDEAGGVRRVEVLAKPPTRARALTTLKAARDALDGLIAQLERRPAARDHHRVPPGDGSAPLRARLR